MDPVLCPTSQHDITDWVNHGMGKKMKTSISLGRYINFLYDKKILTCALDGTF